MNEYMKKQQLDWIFSEFRTVSFQEPSYTHFSTKCYKSLEKFYRILFNGPILQSENKSLPLMRNEGHWFSDICTLMKYESIEWEDSALYMMLVISCSELIYNDKPINYEIMSNCISNFQSLMEQYLAFEAECETLTYAEYQLYAFGKALTKENSVNEGSSELTPTGKIHKTHFNNYKIQNIEKLVSDDFYIELSNLVSRTEFANTYTEKSCRMFCEKALGQPIPSMLLPLLLTLFIVEECNGFDSMHPYLKYKKSRRISKKKEKDVLEIFNGINTILKNQIELVYPSQNSRPEHINALFTFPVFDWRKIADDFSQLNNVAGEESYVTHDLIRLAKYNDNVNLELESQNHLHKFLRCIGKLCNFDSFFRLYFNCEAKGYVKNQFDFFVKQRFLYPHIEGNDCWTIIAATQKYDDLKERMDDPNNNDIYQFENFNYFFKGRYALSPNISAIGLCRYFHLPISTNAYNLNKFFNTLIAAFQTKSNLIVDALSKKFEGQYETEKMSPILSGHEVSKITKLVHQICLKFDKKDKDIESFLSDPAKFQKDKFLLFLDDFCTQNGIRMFSQLDPHLKSSCTIKIYKEILTLVQARVMDKYTAFWEEILSNRLYDSKFQEFTHRSEGDISKEG